MKKSKLPQTYFYKKVVPIPMYFGSFIIVFSNDIEKVANVVNAKPESIGHVYAFTFHNFLHKGYESFCVCFNFWDTQPISLGTLVHEVNHAGNRIMQAREFIPDWENDEAECYLKGWMGDQVSDFMTKCNIT
jgi:hypothetical protein